MQTSSSNGEDRLRQIMLEHEFEFDANAWTRMESTLEAPKPWWRRLLLPFLFLIPAVLLLCLLRWTALNDPGASVARNGQSGMPGHQTNNPGAGLNHTSATPGMPAAKTPDQVLKPAPRDPESVSTEQIALLQAANRSDSRRILPYDIGPAKGQSPALAAHDPHPAVQNFPAETVASSDGDAPTQAPLAATLLALLPPVPPLEDTVENSILRSSAATEPPPVRPVVRTRMQRGHTSWLVGAQAASAGPRLDGGMHLGLSVDYPLRGPWQLRADLLLKKIAGYNLQAAFSDTVYSPFGGIQPYSIRVSDDVLWYLELPVLLRRGLGARQALLFGVRPALVLIGGNAAETVGTVPDAWQRPSLQNGLRRFDFGLCLGWEHRIAPRWWVGLRYQQGLLDLTHDNFFQNTRTHLNSDLQLSLRYIFATF